MADNDLSRESVTLPSSESAVERLCRKILCLAEQAGFDQDTLFGIHLAIEEALHNAVRHGNKMDPAKNVHVEYLITPEKFDISIADDGNGFDPLAVPDPRYDENLYKSSGRGVLLMKSYMDIVEYNKAGNRVHMLKHKVKTDTNSNNTGSSSAGG